jgi:hypothetical protein
MLIEYSFDLGVEKHWVWRVILQHLLDVVPKLILLREHRYHRHLENSSFQPQFMKMQFDVPFLSGQMS